VRRSEQLKSLGEWGTLKVLAAVVVLIAVARVTAASLNGQPVAFKALSPTQVRIRVPSGATSGKIDITTAGGTAESSDDFTVVSG
jgi:hypothetical protein